MGGLALGVGLGIDQLIGQHPWWDRHPDLLGDFDFANGRFRWDGASHADETAFLAAAGGSKSGAQRSIGPYVAPDATELIVNGGFPADLTGWTQVNSTGASASVVSGAARLVGSTNSDGGGAGGAGITQGFATVLGRAYLALYDVLLGTTGIRIGGAMPSGAGIVGGSRAAGAGYRSGWAARATTSHFYGFRNVAGMTGLDNISVKECVPFKGFTQGGFSARIRGVTPAAASGNKVAVSFDVFEPTASATFDAIELVYNAAGELRLQITVTSSLREVNLGAVAVSTPFDVLLTVKAGEVPRARLDSGLPVAGAGTGYPGAAALFIGRHNQPGNSWDGGEPRLQVWAGGGIDQFYGLMDDAIHCAGDSFIAGGSGVVLPTTLQTLMARPVRNTGVGGSTATDIRDRLIAAPAAIKAKTTVIWDGSENPIATVGEVSGYLDLLAAGISALGHQRFVVIPACANYGEADMSVSDAIAAEMQGRWPDNFLDWRSFLTLVAPGSYPADAMFVGLPDDTTHLSQAAMDLAAAAIKAFIEARDW